MTLHDKAHREGFGPGLTWITTLDDKEHPTGIALGVHKLAPGEKIDVTCARETAWLLMDGTAEAMVGEQGATLQRDSLFDDGPSAVHASAGQRVHLQAVTPVEFTVYETANERAFESRLYAPDDVADEPRGKGQVGDACLRFVRTIFDGQNAPKDADLVLGEVITFPGRWSSYPPHSHNQPELYHYRFTHPQGFGHAELGEDVLKVRHGDTVKIFPPHTHAQCAAPGYGMYYSWVIRHLPGDRYTVPTFDDEHLWLTEDGALFWQPEPGKV